MASVLFVLLLLQTIGLVWFVRKDKRRKTVKKDVNPLYGVDDCQVDCQVNCQVDFQVEFQVDRQTDGGDNNQRASADQNYDYMGS